MGTACYNWLVLRAHKRHFQGAISTLRANVQAFAKTFSKITGGANIGKRDNGSTVGFIHECGKEILNLVFLPRMSRIDTNIISRMSFDKNLQILIQHSCQIRAIRGKNFSFQFM